MTRLAIPLWPTIAPHATRYDAWLCDIWGVLHNGAVAFQPAAEACAAFRRQGGRVILVSNAPRPAAAIGVQLAGLGITAESYDAILTSGDVTRTLLRDRPEKLLHLIGAERHRVLIEGLAKTFVDEAAAELVLCSGLFERVAGETPEDYRPVLKRLAARGMPLLCANPDLTADAGGTIVHCAGSLAAIYELLGGTVIYAGKPHDAIYGSARDILAGLAGRDISSSRILAIGDGVNTDIRGAYAAGIDALYIASRVHLTEPYSAETIAQLFAPYAFRPSAAMAALAW